MFLYGSLVWFASRVGAVNPGLWQSLCENVRREAAGALVFALEGRTYRGEFVGSYKGQENEQDIDIVLVHNQPFYLGRRIVVVWQDQGSQFVDVNPDEAMPMSGLEARKTILEELKKNGFELKEQQSGSIWPVWQRRASE